MNFFSGGILTLLAAITIHFLDADTKNLQPA